ncbi:MAG: TonB-dependent receptor [Bacteroidota bacterium]
MVSRLLTRAWLAAVLVALTPAASAQFGAIAGTVTDAESGFTLPGANVVIEGTTQGAATDNDGTYRIARLTPGSYTLVASYLGHTPLTLTVFVAAGETATLDFALALAPVAGQEVVVLGLRAQEQARALTQQQNAANIVNVIAADQIGRFPDATAPEALQRVPGIGVQRDQGEGRFIQIRGAAPQFTTVTFNGERIPSPEGDVRQIALDAIPSELLEAIEVSKAITPDMDADAIGGSVNLVTRRAPATPLLAADVAGGFSALRGEGAVRGSVTGGQRFANNRLGVLGSFSINRRNFASDDLEPEWDFGDDDVPLGDGDNADGLEEVQARYYDLVRQRIGANLALDYDLAPGQSLYLRSVFTQLQDTEQRRRMRFKVGDEELGYEHKNRTEFLRTFNLAGGGDHTFANGLTLDYQLTYAISGEDTPEDVEIAFEQGDVAYDVDLSDPSEPNLGVSMDAINNVSAFEFDSIEPSESVTSNADYVAAVNLGIPYGFGQSNGRLQFGGKFRLKDKTQDVTERAFEFDDFDLALGGNGVNTPFSDVFGDDFDYIPGAYPLPSTITSDDEVLDFIDRYRDLLEEDGDAPVEGDLEDFDATETNVAAYVMTELNVTDRLLVLPGVRYEYTGLESTGNVSVVEFDAEDEEFVLTGTQAQTETSSYGYFFPMLHVRYRVTPRTNVRAAVTTALARPNFFDLAPYRIQDDNEVQIGNPDLDPSRSVNLDLLAEHFTEAIGVFSAGVFYKSISDPIVSVLFEETAENGVGLEVVQSRNGESGYIFGVEVAAQQQLRFLPGALSGLGLYANYTYTDSEATLADGSKGVFPGQAAHIFNVALSYERAGFSGQVSLNYTGEFLDEFAGDGVGADRASDIFVEDRYGLDFTATYQATPQVAVFAEAVNLLNEPLVLYQGVESRPIQREFYQPSGWIGVRFNY